MLLLIRTDCLSTPSLREDKQPRLSAISLVPLRNQSPSPFHSETLAHILLLTETQDIISRKIPSVTAGDFIGEGLKTSLQKADGESFPR